MYKAVIIDDDSTTVNGLKKAVDWRAHNINVVATAQNGKEGLIQIHECQPDIILTDIYMPVMNGIEMLQNLREQGNAAEVLILSGYEDFQHAKTALKLQVNDYLSKPATLEEIDAALRGITEKVKRRSKRESEERELRELLACNVRLAKKQMLKALLDPNDNHSGLPTSMSDYLDLDLSNQVFNVIVIEFFKNRSLNGCSLSDGAGLEYAVNNRMTELAETKQGVYVADNQSNTVTCLIASPTHAKRDEIWKRARDVTGEFMQAIENGLNLQAWAAIGSTVETPESIHLSYREAKNLLAECEYRIDQRLIWSRSESGRLRRFPKRPVEYYQSLLQSITLGQSDLVEYKIGELIGAIQMTEDLSIYVLRDYVIDFMGLLAVALYDHGLAIEDFFPSSNVYKELETLYSLDDLAAWLPGIVLPISKAMETKTTQKHKKKIDFIIRYVEEHYAEDISLDTLTEKVFLTRNYLSQIFKQATGENFNNFLTRIRMEKAKELMRTGHFKLYEISEKVGYKNTAYFSQLFKKYTGYSPSEFNQ